MTFFFYFLRYLKLDHIKLSINADGLENIDAIVRLFIALLWKKLYRSLYLNGTLSTYAWVQVLFLKPSVRRKCTIIHKILKKKSISI
jgi:hypothetical protein